MKLFQNNLLWYFPHIIAYYFEPIILITNLKNDFFLLWSSPNYIIYIVHILLHYICLTVIFRWGDCVFCWQPGKWTIKCERGSMATLQDTNPQIHITEKSYILLFCSYDKRWKEKREKKKNSRGKERKLVSGTDYNKFNYTPFLK